MTDYESLSDGDDCPNCDYGIVTAETNDVGVTKPMRQEVLSCRNCSFSTVKH